MAELKKKVDAFRELFGPPTRMYVSPSGKSYIALTGGEEIWGTVEVTEVGKTKLTVKVDSQIESVGIRWEETKELGLRMEKW